MKPLNGVNDLGAGAVAGFVATIPMTTAMRLLHRRLPWWERYPLPPRRISARLASKTGLRKHLDEDEEKGVTLAAHFGYGTAMGAVYSPVARRVGAPWFVSGPAFGLAVWAGSYLGLLPALGILESATKRPPERNALIIVAHLVWGASLGLAFDGIKNAKTKI
ncbi:MAG: DUF1440 domain-containing protein [Acidobacteria bacterium]|nr:DUF1440 domain-containing protein [Acidobacteriota bacterium]